MTKAEQVRLVTWRSKILQYAADRNRTVTQTRRYFGISRRTYYKWEHRHATDGDAGLCDCPYQKACAYDFEYRLEAEFTKFLQYRRSCDRELSDITPAAGLPTRLF